MENNNFQLNNEESKAVGKNADRLEVFNEESVKALLKTKVMGKNIKFFDLIGSTNDELRSLAYDGAAEGAAVVALNQTTGRGRNGRSWMSADGEGIYFSVLTRPEIEFSKTPVITLISGLSVCKAIRKITGIDALIKWPNDIVVNGKKLCGILSEADAGIDKVNFVVTGIGINCDTKKFPDDLEEIATSVMIEKEEKIDKAKLLAEILLEFEKNYFGYIKDGFGAFFDEYKALSAVIGKPVKIIGKDTFLAEAVDIQKDGGLVVKSNGKEMVVYSGEVSLRL